MVAGVPAALGMSCITGGSLASHTTVWLTENVYCRKAFWKIEGVLSWCLTLFVVFH